MESCEEYLLNAYCVSVREAHYTYTSQEHINMGNGIDEDREHSKCSQVNTILHGIFRL